LRLILQTIVFVQAFTLLFSEGKGVPHGFAARSSFFIRFLRFPQKNTVFFSIFLKKQYFSFYFI